MQIGFSATLKSFVIFLGGIVLGILAYPLLRESITDDRVLALCVLAYLVFVRLAGRAVARRDMRKAHRAQ